MSMPQPPLNKQQHITPPSSFVDVHLTPQQTDEKTFAQAAKVIALFANTKAGKQSKQRPWTEFQLALGEYGETERRIR